jgi:hypothetical protein
MASGRILRFVSHGEHLAWRERWKKGRWVIRSPTPALRDAILKQDEAFRQADARWELNHGRVPGGARVLVFSAGRSLDGEESLWSRNTRSLLRPPNVGEGGF